MYTLYAIQWSQCKDSTVKEKFYIWAIHPSIYCKFKTRLLLTLVSMYWKLDIFCNLCQWSQQRKYQIPRHLQRRWHQPVYFKSWYEYATKQFNDFINIHNRFWENKLSLNSWENFIFHIQFISQEVMLSNWCYQRQRQGGLGGLSPSPQSGHLPISPPPKKNEMSKLKI